MLSYVRQKLANDISGSYMGMFYWFSLLAFLFYYYFPFKLIGLTAVITVTWVAVMILFQEKHKIFFVHYLNITLSGLALYYHWHWGFSFWGFHLERYYCWIVLSASIFAYMGRLIVLHKSKGKENVTEK